MAINKEKVSSISWDIKSPVKQVQICVVMSRSGRSTGKHSEPLTSGVLIRDIETYAEVVQHSDRVQLRLTFGTL